MKKSKFFISFLLVFSVITAFIIRTASTKVEAINTAPISPPTQQAPNNISNDFLVCAVDNAFDGNFHYIDTMFNVWHYYINSTNSGGKYYPEGWQRFGASDDHLFTDNNSYLTGVRNELGNITSHNMLALMQRPKIEYLCYGQRSDYRCVDTPYVQDHDLWFYTFNYPTHIGRDRQDNSGYGNGQYVRFCRIANSTNDGNWFDSPGLVVKRLRTNGEQCHKDNGYYAWRGDSQSDWFIKPRIRIDSLAAHDPLNPLVCNIKVIAQNGIDTLKSIDILARNFLDNNGNYNGQYLEEFYNLSSSDELKITGDWVRPPADDGKWFRESRVDQDTINENWNPYCNHADIQVYWYGNCDMWIDYVRVDNDIANDLLSMDSLNQNHNTYLNWLQWEGHDLTQNESAAFKFYIELFEFNQIPCIAYVNHKLDSLSGRHVDMFADQLTLYECHMDWYSRGKIMTPDQMINEYVNKVGSTQVFGGTYPLTSIEDVSTTYSRIPNTLPTTNGGDILAKAIEPADYDAWLQYQLDTICDNFEGQGGSYSPVEPCTHMMQYAGLYRWSMKLCSGISKQANIPFISWVQAHQEFNHCGEIEREPTAEELGLLSYLPVSYGAKGVVYYSYPGGQWTGHYEYGITETDETTPRVTNVYGEPKLDTLVRIIHRLKKWGPTLMSFDNTQTNSYIYRISSERTDMSIHSFINDMVTYYPSQTAAYCPEPDNPGVESPSGLTYDCKDKRYIQAATFKKQPDDRNLYFMIVNRRCSPFIDASSIRNNGGRRDVQVKFNYNTSYFNGYNSWKIINLEDNSGVMTFNKNSAVFLDLGWYMPGEGKLYKMVPAN